jgi:hypothetical protein
MSPFYFKEGERRVRWKGDAHDFRGKNGQDLGVTIFNVKDPEQLRVSVDCDTENYVLGKRGDVIFPGRESELNRDGFRIVNAVTRKTLAVITHREPRKRK